MKILKITGSDDEIVLTTEKYFPNYRRLSNGVWFHEIADGWIKVLMVDGIEKAYQDFKWKQLKKQQNEQDSQNNTGH